MSYLLLKMFREESFLTHLAALGRREIQLLKNTVEKSHEVFVYGGSICSRRFRLVSYLERHRVASSFSLSLSFSAAPTGPT